MGNSRTGVLQAEEKFCHLTLLLAGALPQVKVVQECICEVRMLPIQSPVPFTEVLLQKAGSAVHRWAAYPLLGQLLEQLLFAKRTMQKAGLSLLLESLWDGGKTSFSSTTQLPDTLL